MMRESDVQAAFVAYLDERGWVEIETRPRGIDVTARRGAEVLKAEVKGSTSEPGLDVDTLFGQALRMFRDDDPPTASYAIVVPADLAPKVERVCESTMHRICLDVYFVDDSRQVRRGGSWSSCPRES